MGRDARYFGRSELELHMTPLLGQLQSILHDLGLQRRAKPVADLAAYLATRTTAAGLPTGAKAPEGSSSAACQNRCLLAGSSRRRDARGD